MRLPHTALEVSRFRITPYFHLLSFLRVRIISKGSVTLYLSKHVLHDILRKFNVYNKSLTDVLLRKLQKTIFATGNILLSHFLPLLSNLLQDTHLLPQARQVLDVRLFHTSKPFSDSIQGLFLILLSSL